MAKVAVIILTFNCLIPCLESIYSVKNKKLSLVVVDNLSFDGPALIFFNIHMHKLQKINNTIN